VNTSVDAYFVQGCGRCKLGGTPQCKVNRWAAELQLLRQLLLASGLNEECKWGMPCYTLNGQNVALLAAFKEYCSINFFKGALLSNEWGMLSSAGENSQAGRLIKITSIEQVNVHAEHILNTLLQAVNIEKSGQKVPQRSIDDEEVPLELLTEFAADPELERAFRALTPGRQRGYLLFFRGAKQSATRTSRILKNKDRILKEKGLQDP
jgi:uncharacterized protein YdeI (YjbR/CyaY-like superfamily)